MSGGWYGCRMSYRVLAFLVTLSVAAICQTPEAGLTSSMFNGRWWQLAGVTERVTISRWFARWAGDHADNAAGKVRGYEDLCRAVQGERLYAAGINGRNRCNL